MIENVIKLIKSIAAVIAVVPGMAMLAKAVQTPPPQQDVIAALSLSVGVAIVIAIILLQRGLRRIPPGYMAAGVVVLAVAGALLAFQYVSLVSRYVVVYTDSGTEVRVTVPYRPSAPLARLLDDFNWDYSEALESHVRGMEVRRLVDKEANSTTLLMVVYLLAAQILTLTAIVAGAWKAAQILGNKNTG